MKTLASILLMLCLYNGLAAQDDAEKPTLSKAEEFSRKSGTLIQKEFIKVGAVKTIKFQVLKIKDLIAGTKTTALRMEYPAGSYNLITEIDTDEMDGFIKSIKTFQDDIFNTKPSNYTEVVFKSRTGFRAGAHFEALREKWIGYFRIETFDRNPTNIYLTREDYVEILGILEKAKKMM